jgi:serine phosphatase RsbU (regulator of sigma subunit)
MLGTEQSQLQAPAGSRFNLHVKWTSPAIRRLYLLSFGLTALVQLIALGTGLIVGPQTAFLGMLLQLLVGLLILSFTVYTSLRDWSDKKWYWGAGIAAGLVITTGLVTGEYFNIMLTPLLIGLAQRQDEQRPIILWGLAAIVLSAVELLLFSLLPVRRELPGVAAAGTILTAFTATLLSLMPFMGRYQHQVKEYRLEAENKASEMEVAHEIQTSLMPPNTVDSGNWSLAARSLPARDVGGDFYEYVQHPNQEHLVSGIAIGDVAGKGIPAALQMAVVRTLFRVEARRRIFPGETLMSVNMALQAERSFGMVTMLYAFLDSNTNTLHVSNAGHNYPLLLNGTLDEIKLPGLPLGIDDGIEYEEKVIKITPGTSVILYTDGVPEAMNAEGDLYTFERFKDAIQANRHLGPVEMVDKILDEISVFTKGAPQSDDITVVVLQYHPHADALDPECADAEPEPAAVGAGVATKSGKSIELEVDEDGVNWI